MSNLICLNEIEEPHIYHSELSFISTKLNNTYCVLAEGRFIVFKKPIDIVSLFRIPLNKDTKIQFSNNEFKIICNKFNFTFSHLECAVIQSWNKHLKKAIESDNRNLLQNFHAEVISIDRISKNECPIVIGKRDCRLFIYKDYEYQKFDICTHIINLKFYQVDNFEFLEKNSRSSLKAFTIKSAQTDYKLSFKDHKKAAEWNIILRDSVKNYINNSTDGNVLEKIYKNISNTFCADCGVKEPKWVSVNICVTVCDNCVGQHRQLGTRISRTQSATIDEKCWKDSLLVQLLNEIGNKVANEFWCRNVPIGEIVSVERKYKDKQFIDLSFFNLTTEERLEKLSDSVSSDNIVNTMKLWFSNVTDYQRKNVEKLLEIAQKSERSLQKKFLSLQTNICTEPLPIVVEQKLSSLFAGVFYLSYDQSPKISLLFAVTLYSDRIIISKEDPTILARQNIDICTIYLADLTTVVLTSQKSLFLTCQKPVRFFTAKNDRDRSSFVTITNLTLSDNVHTSLIVFKTRLLKLLLGNCFMPPVEETAMFLLVDVYIDDIAKGKCQCHVTKTDFVICSPVDTKYDLSKARSLSLGNDRISIAVDVAQDHLSLRTEENSQIILSCLSEATKIQLMPLDIKKFDCLIDFLKVFGLNSEKIFELDDDTVKVNNLYRKLLTSSGKMTIEKDYSVHEVASCLKKVLLYSEEPLVPESVFIELKYATYSDKDEDDRLKSYQNCLKFLATENKVILNNMVELLFFIYLVANHDHTEKSRLANALGRYILSPRDDDSHDCCVILQYFIENFIQLFEYSEENQINMIIFVDKILSSPQCLVKRTIFIESSLVPVMDFRILKETELEKFSFLDKINSFTGVSLCLNNFQLVQDLYVYLFPLVPLITVNLWHVVFLKNKCYRRLLSTKDSVKITMIDRLKFPATYLVGKQKDLYVFIHAEPDIIGTSNLLQCEVKLTNERRSSNGGRNARYTLFLSASNSLKIYDNSTTPIYDFTLVGLNLYRSMDNGASNVYFLQKDGGVVNCEFRNNVEYKEFLYYFDKFKSQS